jgi:hypothetical protein
MEHSQILLCPWADDVHTFRGLDSRPNYCHYYKPDFHQAVAHISCGLKGPSSGRFRALGLPLTLVYSTDADGKPGFGLNSPRTPADGGLGEPVCTKTGMGFKRLPGNTDEGHFLHFGAIGRYGQRAENDW